MATNRVHEDGRHLTIDVSSINGSGTGDLVRSGDPGVIGGIAFVAETDEGSDGKATVDTGGVYRLNVRGHSGAANAAVNVGDTVYWDNTNGELDNDAAGRRFGTALDPVAAGATTAIRVRVGYFG